MYYTKTRLVKSPQRGTNKSAGIDFFVPEFTDEFLSDLQKKSNVEIEGDNIILNPHSSVLIPAGIKVNLEKTRVDFLHTWNGIYLNAHNKSGIASKHGLIKGAETVDEDYQGELHINVINTTDEIRYIRENSKLIQFILEETNYITPIEIETETELFTSESERGVGGFGSTGN